MSVSSPDEDMFVETSVCINRGCTLYVLACQVLGDSGLCYFWVLCDVFRALINSLVPLILLECQQYS